MSITSSDVHSQQAVSEVDEALGFVGEELRGDLEEAPRGLMTMPALRRMANGEW